MIRCTLGRSAVLDVHDPGSGCGTQHLTIASLVRAAAWTQHRITRMQRPVRTRLTAHEAQPGTYKRPNTCARGPAEKFGGDTRSPAHYGGAVAPQPARSDGYSPTTYHVSVAHRV